MDFAWPERLHVADAGRQIRPIFTLAAGSSRIPYARGLTLKEICCGSIRAAQAAQAHFVASPSSLYVLGKFASSKPG